MEYENIINDLGKKSMVTNLQSYSKKLPRSYGESSSSTFSTDMANQYIVELVKEIYDQQGVLNASTQPISTTPSNIVSQAALLTDAYIKVINNSKSFKGIYTVWTAATQNLKISHQNWLYYDIGKKILYRLEPNGKNNDKSYPELKMNVFCDQIILNLRSHDIDAEWKFAIDFAINNFNGCRATSTILATMYLKGIDVESLKKIISDKTPDTTKALSFILQKEIEKCKITFTRTTRSSKDLKIFSPV